jgi:hypothetical protein
MDRLDQVARRQIRMRNMDRAFVAGLCFAVLVTLQWAWSSGVFQR